jgi:hypothetical protein
MQHSKGESLAAPLVGRGATVAQSELVPTDHPDHPVDVAAVVMRLIAIAKQAPVNPVPGRNFSPRHGKNEMINPRSS